jgi:hypothetical protein
MENRKPKKQLIRKYKFEGQHKYNNDTPLPLWEGQKITDVINGIYSGTNFYLVGYRTKKLNKNKTLVLETIAKK